MKKLREEGRILFWLANFLSHRKYRVVAPTKTKYVEFDNGATQSSSAIISALIFIL